MKQYDEKLFTLLTQHRNNILYYLRETNNYYYHDEITIEVSDRLINYFRWKHPN